MIAKDERCKTKFALLFQFNRMALLTVRNSSSRRYERAKDPSIARSERDSRVE